MATYLFLMKLSRFFLHNLFLSCKISVFVKDMFYHNIIHHYKDGKKIYHIILSLSFYNFKNQFDDIKSISKTLQEMSSDRIFSDVKLSANSLGSLLIDCDLYLVQ